MWFRVAQDNQQYEKIRKDNDKTGIIEEIMCSNNYN